MNGQAIGVDAICKRMEIDTQKMLLLAEIKGIELDPKQLENTHEVHGYLRKLVEDFEFERLKFAQRAELEREKEVYVEKDERRGYQTPITVLLERRCSELRGQALNILDHDLTLIKDAHATNPEISSVDALNEYCRWYEK